MHPQIRLIFFLLAIVSGSPVHAQAPGRVATGVAWPDETLFIAGLHLTKNVHILLPENYTRHPERRYPVIYMHDAQNLFARAPAESKTWDVGRTLRFLAEHCGFEAILVGIDHGGENRIKELSPWPNPRFGAAEGLSYMQFIVTEVKPRIDLSYRTLAGPQSTAMIGSSLGGLMTHYAAHAFPEVFAKAGVFSPAYWFASQVIEHTQQHPLPPDARLYLFIGDAEGEEALSGALDMHALLASQHPPGWSGLALSIRKGGTHDETAWREELPRALIWLFGLDSSGGASCAVPPT